jgi:tRNA threonylcarbamoyladenosine biosynthesis protein TsaE
MARMREHFHRPLRRGSSTLAGVERLVTGPEDMVALGRALGRLLESGDAVALTGDLGAGKTLFARGVAEGLGYGGPVTSPTFTLIHVYEGGRATMFHADLYRIDREEELEDVGLDDVFRQDGVAVIEWADRFPAALPEDRLEVRLEVVAAEVRLARARGLGARSARLLEAWASAG